MKLRDLLHMFRMRPLQGDGQRPIDNVDGLSSAPAQDLKGVDFNPGPTAPTNWVPSQQDDRPLH